MMQGLAGAISKALSDIGHVSSGPTADWTHPNLTGGQEFHLRMG